VGKILQGTCPFAISRGGFSLARKIYSNRYDSQSQLQPVFFFTATVIMSSPQQDSAWTLMREAVARAASISPKSLLAVLTLSITSSFYTIAGTRFDILCNITIFAYLHHSTLISWLLIATPYFPSICILLMFTIAGYLLLVTRSSAASPWTGPGKPHLIPCRTTHQRFFPKKHSFSYSYLTIGIPVGYQGNINGMIGIDDSPKISTKSFSLFAQAGVSRSWYTVNASDHLQRGQDGLDLRGKLDRHLQSEV
jgi:hypothetical protein